MSNQHEGTGGWCRQGVGRFPFQQRKGCAPGRLRIGLCCPWTRGRVSVCFQPSTRLARASKPSQWDRRVIEALAVQGCMCSDTWAQMCDRKHTEMRRRFWGESENILSRGDNVSKNTEVRPKCQVGEGHICQANKRDCVYSSGEPINQPFPQPHIIWTRGS